MKFDVDTLPDIFDLVDQNVIVTITPETTETIIESNPVVTGFSADVVDSGMTVGFTSSTGTLAGSYVEKYDIEIAYAEPQVDLLTKPVYQEVSGWDAVPEPTATEDIWFLYKYKAPEDLTTRTVTYTAVGTMTTETVPGAVITNDVPFIATIVQLVDYDIETNSTEFKRYL